MSYRKLLAAAVGLAFAQPLRMAEDAPASLLDMDDVLGQNIDGVEDAPEFITPAAGTYLLNVQSAKAEKYKTNDKDSGEEVEKIRLKIVYSVNEVIEIEDTEEAPPAVGSLFSEQFMTNPDGLSYFKRQAKNILGEDTIKGVTIQDILNELPNATAFQADVKLKITRKKTPDGEKKYTNVQVRIKPQQQADLAGDPVAA